MVKNLIDCKTAVHTKKNNVWRKTHEEGEKSVETVDATINNVLQSNYRAIGWVGDTGWCFGGAKGMQAYIL